MIASWLRTWEYLEKNPETESITEIAKESGMSYMTTLDGLRILEDVGYININQKGNKKEIVITQKFIETRDNVKNILDAAKRCKQL